LFVLFILAGPAVLPKPHGRYRVVRRTSDAFCSMAKSGDAHDESFLNWKFLIVKIDSTSRVDRLSTKSYFDDSILF